MRLTRLTVLFLLFGVTNVFGLTDPCVKSTEGTDFWFGFMEGRNYQVGHYNEVTLTSSYTCKYQIFIGKSSTPSFSGTVLPNIPLKIMIDWHLVEATGSESIQERAIHLVSDKPLNVYALNWSDSSSEVALIFPAVSLGNEYYAMCYTPHINGNGINSGSGRNSEFLLVASQDNTLIQIAPSKVTDKGKPANATFSVTLNKGEVYQVQSENLPVPLYPGQGDLTGSYITSNKPVALYSGSLSTTVPADASVSAWDHLYEQMPPLQTWGRKFITVPLKTRHEDTYRIMAAEDNTTVRIGNKSPVVLNKGAFYEFMLLYNEPSLIESDKPVLLAQFSNSNSVDKTYTNGDGDPFMVIVSPVNQTREKVAFVAYESAKINSKFFINVVVKDDVVGKIKLDNLVVPFVSLSGTGYSYAQISLAKGDHYIESTEPGKGFIAYVYGFGGVEAYGYGVGFNLDIVLDLGSNINSNGDKLLVRCDGGPTLTLNAGNAFDKYLWSTGETTSAIQIANSGWYKVKVSNADGCVLQDSVQLQVSKPVINLGNDTTICNPATILLDAGLQGHYSAYSWSTPLQNPKDQKVTASYPGKYSVEAINLYGCKAKDTINISFTNKPKFNFSGLDTLICGQKSTLLNVSADKGSFTAQRLTDNYIFNNLNVTVPDFGTYNLKIRATDEFSCYADSVVQLGFRKTPSIDFSIDSTTCYNYNLNVKYSGNAGAASDFTWVFGGDTIVHGIGVDTYIVPLGINRATRDLKLTVTDQGCPNDKTLRDIKVIPNLQMKVLDSIGCEPFTTKFVAQNTETVTYDWNFGDGNVLSGAKADPSNTYQKEGYYPVMLKVTTSKGCTNQVKIDSMVYVAPIPTVGFTALPAMCLEKENHSISYAGTGGQLDTYFWNLSEFTAIEIIQNPNSTQGPLIFNLTDHPQANIRLNVVSKYGCHSDTASVLVKRKPSFSVDVSPNAGCTPLESLFKGTVKDAVDKLNYNWDFGDGTKGTGAQAKHSYEVPNHK
ncbi:MAG: PKD domain-containing protein, partial [Mariniphaga sp.]